MKTTIDIPENELKQVIRFTGSRTKREAVTIAIKEFNQRRRLEQLAKMLGTFTDFMSREDLDTMRETDLLITACGLFHATTIEHCDAHIDTIVSVYSAKIDT